LELIKMEASVFCSSFDLRYLKVIVITYSAVDMPS
jgi:hypothetical protein